MLTVSERYWFSSMVMKAPVCDAKICCITVKDVDDDILSSHIHVNCNKLLCWIALDVSAVSNRLATHILVCFGFFFYRLTAKYTNSPAPRSLCFSRVDFKIPLCIGETRTTRSLHFGGWTVPAVSAPTVWECLLNSRERGFITGQELPTAELTGSSVIKQLDTEERVQGVLPFTSGD